MLSQISRKRDPIFHLYQNQIVFMVPARCPLAGDSVPYFNPIAELLEDVRSRFFPKYEMRFGFRQEKNCLGEDRISPCKPTSYIVISINQKNNVLEKSL